MAFTQENDRLTCSFEVDPNRTPYAGEDLDSKSKDLPASTQSGQEAGSDPSYKFQFAEGRRYHQEELGTYAFPNDDKEYSRLDLQHHIFRLCVNNALYLAPLKKDLGSALDIGCGSGTWTTEFAEEYPNTQVVGIDISPTAPKNTPKNCKFEIRNAEVDWDPVETYDYIHARAVLVGIKSWSGLIERSFKHLKPGGYLELQELTFPFCCVYPEDREGSKFIKWTNTLAEGGSKLGSDFSAALKFREQMEKAGFVDIHIKWIHWPVGPWAKDPYWKRIGKLLYTNFIEVMDQTAVVINRGLGMSIEDVQKMVSEAKPEVVEQKRPIFLPVCFCYAKKPESA